MAELAMQLIFNMLQQGLERKCIHEINFYNSRLWCKFTGTGKWPANFYLWHLSSKECKNYFTKFKIIFKP